MFVSFYNFFFPIHFIRLSAPKWKCLLYPNWLLWNMSSFRVTKYEFQTSLKYSNNVGFPEFRIINSPFFLHLLLVFFTILYYYFFRWCWCHPFICSGSQLLCWSVAISNASMSSVLYIQNYRFSPSSGGEVKAHEWNEEEEWKNHAGKIIMKKNQKKYKEWRMQCIHHTHMHHLQTHKYFFF